jgi:zinc transporter 2
MRKLLFVSFICLIFMGCEVAGGIISGSLAILTDAAHMFSDVSGFLISYFAIMISQNKAHHEKSMGYHRAEIIGAILAIILIWGLLVWLVIEAYKRLLDPPDVDAKIMLITSIVGFICNLVNFFALEGQCCIKKIEREEEEEEINPNELSYYESIK